MLIYDKNAVSDDKGRLYFFDNAKFILIFLVVLAHAVGPLKNNAFASVIWVVINSFHMPAMIFISGFFAKRYISKTREIKVQRIVTFAILYLAAQVCFFLFTRFALGTTATFASLLLPRAALWFLLCLIGWHVMLPVLNYFKPKHVLIAAVLMGLLIGYENEAASFLSISRFFVHLPAFMAGYYIKQEHIDKLHAKKGLKWIGLAIFAAVTAVCAIWFRTDLRSLLVSNTPYAKIPLVKAMPQALQWSARLGFYVVAAALIFAFLVLVPRGKAIFTTLGKETLSVYLLHIPLYLANNQLRWYLLFDSPGGIALLCLIALVLTVVLSLKPFTLPFHWLQSIKVRTREPEGET